MLQDVSDINRGGKWGELLFTFLQAELVRLALEVSCRQELSSKVGSQPTHIYNSNKKNGKDEANHTSVK